MTDPLYQAEILALAKRGRAVGRLESPTVTARVDNPICGDRITIDLAVEDGRITAVGAKVQGCALCQAATAVIAEEAIGVPAATLERAGTAVAGYLAGTLGEGDLPWTRLSSFAPVQAVRARHDCVMLPFKAASRALASLEAVSS
jgi:nitrogen fixation NifU-like protein